MHVIFIFMGVPMRCLRLNGLAEGVFICVLRNDYLVPNIYKGKLQIIIEDVRLIRAGLNGVVQLT